MRRCGRKNAASLSLDVFIGFNQRQVAVWHRLIGVLICILDIGS